MLRADEGDDDLFFDSLDYLSLEESIITKEEFGCGKLEYEIWLSEPQSVKERRQSFLQGMGLVELVSKRDEIIGPDRMTSCSDTVQSSSDSCVTEGENFTSCGRETISDANSMFDEKEQNLLDHPNVACENENLGPLPAMQECEHGSDKLEKYDAGKKKMKSWWKFFVNKRKERGGNCVMNVSKLNSKAPQTNRIKVKQNRKSCMEFTGLYMGQKIQAHKGFIWTMKFSPDGQYLATGGEDGIVRIWHVISMDAACKSFSSESNFGSNWKEGKSKFGAKKMTHVPIVIPEKNFQIEESPLQEFYGHDSDVLDLAWSNSNLLLSSSQDKTVCLWQVGCDYCLKVFRHSNYVTCIQFDPLDENYFISGSIDGKVRIWGVNEELVVDWVDIRDVISAISYQPEGKGFVVGSITGSCRFYQVSGDGIQLEGELNIQGKKKTSGNRITGIQFCKEKPQRVMITSEDSKLRIFDGVDIVHKFKGLPKSGSQMSASFTSTGRHIISVGEDCRVYVWNYDRQHTPLSKHVKSVQSCEHFLSEGVSVAVPWTGMGTGQSDKIWAYMQLEDGVSWRRDSERFSLGNWFFMDGPCRGASTTWPEEKLPSWNEAIAETECQNDLHQHQPININDHMALSDAWGLVIVTAGWDGTIKTFHNHGLPIRL